MSLKTRIFLVLAVVVSVFVVADTAWEYARNERVFADIERDLALSELEQALLQLRSEVGEVGFICRNLSQKDAGMVPDPDREDEDGYQDPFEVYEDMDLLYLCEEGGRVLFGRIQDPTSRSTIRLRDFPAQSLAPTHPLIESVSVSGVMMTEHGPLLISALPVKGDRGLGRERLIVGRFLTQHTMNAIATRMNRSVRFFQLDGLDEALRETSERVTITGQEIVDEGNEGPLLLYDVVNDVRGLPILLVEVAVPRDVTKAGQVSRLSSVMSKIAQAVLMTLAIMLLLQRIVIGPVQRVTDHATMIQITGDTSVRLELDRQDEIGVLGRELDRMVEELDNSRKEKMELARMAGISEVATGILHNVGNVLNSVNVSADVVNRSLEKIPMRDFEHVLKILEEHREDLAGFLTSDPRGRHLVPLLTELFTLARGQQENALSELDLLRLNIEHINDLVQSQQNYLGRSSGAEWTSLTDQVAMALRVCAENRDDFGDLEVVHELQTLPRIQLDRHKTLQILVNLLLNACDSLSKSDVAHKVLTVRIGEGERGYAFIEVEDNGVGIPEDDLLRVFLPGFTTRGQSMGLGLHMAATNAMEMGGELAVHSDGPGQGARFVLRLPMERRAEVRAA